MFLLLGNSIWNTGVSPFIISEGWPKKTYGFLWTLNGILIFAAQPLVTVIKRWFASTSTAQMTVSALFYLGGYAVLLWMPTYSGLVLGMVLATLGEMLISPAMPSFISDHAGRSAPFYLGLSGGMGAVGRVIGPYLMGRLYDSGGLSAYRMVGMCDGTAIRRILYCSCVYQPPRKFTGAVNRIVVHSGFS